MKTFAIRIKPAVHAELAAASLAELRGEFYTAFQHLERAHVLGQATTVEHVRVHWRMFRFALRNRRHGEASGQLWRIFTSSIFTAPRLVPEGNTGGTDAHCRIRAHSSQSSKCPRCVLAEPSTNLR